MIAILKRGPFTATFNIPEKRHIISVLEPEFANVSVEPYPLSHAVLSKQGKIIWDFELYAEDTIADVDVLLYRFVGER